ncbi:OsmC family protein [Neomoorella thermoacetica]|uniref:OsmC family protein n=1 Tax=Neomoorella thermoacetica TaxID=1525 RepID=UPI0008FBA335|nr:OsmC family protein [Moorella thermoacetica]APC09115.1 hydroperoxide reductase [Moorella thermoacetica]OIQ53079.1 hydroperoxide reductase [Moorella thermoacetica]
MAKTTFTATVRWTGEGLYCQGQARGFQVAVDEPPQLGGTDKAMNPVELLLCALGGCMSICAATFAPACHVELKDFRVELEGDLDPDGFLGKNRDVRKGYQQIRYRIHIDSPSPERNIKRLLDMIEERCPVSDTLKGVEVVKQVTGNDK